MHGAYERRPSGGLPEHLTNFRDQVREVRLRDKRRRPQALVELGLRERLRAVDDQEVEQVERLGREMLLVAVPEQLPTVGVESERSTAGGEARRGETRWGKKVRMSAPNKIGRQRRGRRRKCGRGRGGG